MIPIIAYKILTKFTIITNVRIYTCLTLLLDWNDERQRLGWKSNYRAKVSEGKEISENLPSYEAYQKRACKGTKEDNLRQET